MLGATLLGLGAALVAFAVTWALVCYPAQLKLPLDIDTQVVATNPGTVLDMDSVDSGKLRVEHDVPIRYVQQVTSVEPGDAHTVTVQIGTAISRTDVQGDAAIVQATVQRIALDRLTAMPTADAGNSAIQTEADKPSVPTHADGLTVTWPLDTQRVSYPFYDATARVSQPIDFLGDDDVRGLPVYRFGQKVSDVDLARIDPSNAFTLPASTLPDSAPESLRKRTGDVELHVYYSVDRVYEVEPRTGQVVAATEKIDQYLGTKPGERAVPVFSFDATLDDASVDHLVDGARDTLRSMSLAGTWLPWLTGIAGGLLFVTGAIIRLRGSRAA